MSVDWDGAVGWDDAIDYAATPGVGLYKLEVDWNGDGDYSDTGEDITARTIRITTTVGAPRSLGRSGRNLAGSLTATLNNASGDYSPLNTSSPLTGNIIPGRPVKLSCYYPVDQTMWTGTLETIVPSVGPQGQRLANLRAIGPMRALDTSLRVAMKTSVTTGAAMTEILDKVGFSGTARSIDTGQTTMTRWWQDETIGWRAAREVEATEHGLLRETAAGSIAFEDRHHRLTSPQTVSQGTYSDDPDDDLTYIEIEMEDALSLIFNEFRASIRGYSTGSVAVLWTHPEANTTGDALKIPVGETLSFEVRFPNPDSATNAVGVNAWTTPSLGAGADIEVWSANNGTGTNLSTSNIGISVTKFGNQMKVVLTNNHASLDGFMTVCQARGTPLAVSDPTSVYAEDSASQTKYGLRVLPQDEWAKWIPTSTEAQGWAYWMAAVFGEPVPMVRISATPNVDKAHFANLLAREVSDRITVKASTTKTQLGINEDFFIESISHTINPGRYHEVHFQCAQAAQWSDAFTWGTTKWGTSARWSW